MHLLLILATPLSYVKVLTVGSLYSVNTCQISLWVSQIPCLSAPIRSLALKYHSKTQVNIQQASHCSSAYWRAPNLQSFLYSQSWSRLGSHSSLKPCLEGTSLTASATMSVQRFCYWLTIQAVLYKACLSRITRRIEPGRSSQHNLYKMPFPPLFELSS